jgi:hypothetical protein
MHAYSAIPCNRRRARNKKDENNEDVKSATLQDDPLAVEAKKLQPKKKRHAKNRIPSPRPQT